MNFAPTAQEEAEKINAQTGIGLVVDQSFWEKQGVSTGEELAKTILAQTYSDFFKELKSLVYRYKEKKEEEVKHLTES